jgi:hypothetical protein
MVMMVLGLSHCRGGRSFPFSKKVICACRGCFPDGWNRTGMRMEAPGEPGKGRSYSIRTRTGSPRESRYSVSPWAADREWTAARGGTGMFPWNRKSRVMSLGRFSTLPVKAASSTTER